MIDLSKFIKSISFAWRGLGTMFYSENNARIHALVSGGVIISGCWVGLSRGEWVAVFSAMAFVWVCEAFNTAFEKTIDLVSPEYQKLAGEVKDIAAGAVLVSAIFAVIVGILVFGKYIPGWEDFLDFLGLLPPQSTEPDDAF